jgi:hypothetical protein
MTAGMSSILTAGPDDAEPGVTYRAQVMYGDSERWPRNLSPGAVDVGLALAVAATLVLTIAIADEPDATLPTGDSRG